MPLPTQKLQTAVYDVSSVCDYRCIYCRNDWSDDKNLQQPEFNRTKTILTEFRKQGFERVIFTGGEFFIMSQWKDVLHLSKELGLEVWVITNGYSISHDDVPYLEDHISRINVSFHAPSSKLYNEVMVPPSNCAFRKVLKNMYHIGQSKIALGVFFSPIKANYALLYDTIKKLVDEGVKIDDVNVNRIVNTESTADFFAEHSNLGLFEHRTLVQQVLRINEELGISASVEAYPLCFLGSIIKDEERAESINQPCHVGRGVLAFNHDGTMKLCPATSIAMSEPLPDDAAGVDNEQLHEFRSAKWRHQKCKDCSEWKVCLGGCHAATGQMYADDPLMIVDRVDFVEGIDNAFFDILADLYDPFLSTSYKRASIKYTIFSKARPEYPIGIIALKNTGGGACFIEIAVIPEAKGHGYSFLAITEFLRKHSHEKIGWTVHKANLPSIKLLKKLNGGFFEKTVKNKKRIEAEGFFRPNGTVSKKMSETIDRLIIESAAKYRTWCDDFQGRTQELTRLHEYQREYANENN